MHLAHQPLVARLNRRAAAARINARLDEMDRYTTPLLRMVMGASAVVIVGLLGGWIQ